jgi:hypothetical protein
LGLPRDEGIKGHGESQSADCDYPAHGRRRCRRPGYLARFLWASDEQVVEGVRRSYARSVGADVASSIASKLTVPQEVTVGDKTWRVALRPTRFYKGFSVTLLKTTHDVYPVRIFRRIFKAGC